MFLAYKSLNRGKFYINKWTLKFIKCAKVNRNISMIK